ncbi:DUF6119 family protein [Nocardioides zeae]|uniref:Sporadically distributed protein, TIGR04141 family n=1 Tax=Nocardioides zeae TaxID=1457234 RepID=A0A6P0HH90_9ACTN|nr:DUF6119 family protein [Nocardioides zeae]NEN77657.1 hypothetical protein [Nocardioides zeae]
MAKARSFSIFLLKEDYDTPTKALKADHGLSKALHDGAVGKTWPTYLASKPGASPWWRDYFGISTPVAQGFAGAIVFVTASNRTFALTFGHTRHHLRDEAYEYDFGLRTTLNAVDPKEIRNTDELDPATSRRRRTQLAERSDINYFDFDGDSAVLRSLTGAIRPEYKALFSHATGASNLRVSSKKLRGDLPDLLKEIFKVYQKDTYRTAFPDAINIQPVRDPAELARLDKKLEAAVQTKSDGLTLTIPELVDFQEDFEVSYSGAGKSQLYPEASLDDYYTYLDTHSVDLSVLTAERLQHDRLCVTTDDGARKGDYSIYKSLVFETTLDGQATEAYHLSEGTWYKVEADYLKALAAEIDPLFNDGNLPTRTVHYESEYNKDQLVPHWSGSVLLDTTNISPKGQRQVEPCDVARSENKTLILTHVKLGVHASDLSHLFNQGTTSLDLLYGVPEARDKLDALIKGRDSTFDLSGLSDQRFKVEYVIVTKNDVALASGALPLFSRISLRRAARTLTSMRTEAKVMLVKDAYTAPPRKKQNKPAKRTAARKATSPSP